MNIALIGYGKMGQAIEKIAIERGHNVVFKIDKDNTYEFNAENFKQVDVAIEFTMPELAVPNMVKCFDYGVPVVCGTTAWLDKEEYIKDYCKQKNGTLLYASNFSIGVNLFFELNKYLAKLMAPQKAYTVSMEEIHHTQKKDAPSGTGITLAEGILANYPIKTKWVNNETVVENELPIISKRIDPAPGTHTINYGSFEDDITITHTAHNRQGFATGAVLAAEYIAGKKGIFTMKQVLGL